MTIVDATDRAICNLCMQPRRADFWTARHFDILYMITPAILKIHVKESDIFFS